MVANSGRPCTVGTLQDVVATAGMVNKYHARAHILELTPMALTFPMPAIGAWLGVLTVEAYQM
ncbi:MAG: hypothetical protein PV362_02795 [Providencia heimbachae]|nr:hypothetical protein [Providencia heimbachae]